MMRAFALILLFLSLSHAMYGPSTLTIERTWTIIDGGGPVDFKGALAMDGGSQNITYFEISKGAETYADEAGTLWVRYRGQNNESAFTVRGKATVQVDFANSITADGKLPKGQAEPSELTAYDSEITSTAYSLADSNSSLQTVANLVNWVNVELEYDESYWDKTMNASQVFSERRGVCVQYTHLLISMARSLGFETRYVSGYVYVNGWQPHAWAQIHIPGNGWVPADATLGQAGDLDSTHLAISTGEDQLSNPDILLSKNANSTLSVHDSLTTDSISNDSSNINISTSLDTSSYLLSVNVTNSAESYYLGAYSLSAPVEYGISESSLILLEPNGSMVRYYGLNYSLFNNSHSYAIPVSVRLNDVRKESLLSVNGNHSCIMSAALFLLLLAALWGNTR